MRAILGSKLAAVIVGVAGVLAVTLVAAQAIQPGSGIRERGPAGGCQDVAAAIGLEFRGDYGEVYPARDEAGRMWQRNLGNGAAVGDYDGDGWLDVFLAGQAGHASRLFRNVAGPDGGRRFVDVTEQAGLDIRGNVRVAQFVDLGSGRPDLVVATDHVPGKGGEPSRIFRNDGDGTFTDVTAGSGFEPTGFVVGGMTFADFDGSGRPSIYLSYWTREVAGDPGLNRIEGEFPGMNRLYRNLGGYRFRDVTLEAGIGTWRADSFTAIFADLTGDHQADIYQASDHRPDRFFVNDGGHFTDTTIKAGLIERAGNSMGVAAADLTGSGGLDLYVTHISDPDRRFGNAFGNTLMVSTPSGTDTTFTNDAAARGILETAWGWGTAFVDHDLDGDLDLYAVQGMRELVGEDGTLDDATATLFRNDGTGRAFTVTRGTGCDVPGDQRALVVFDYDRDGAPDLLITQVAGPALLLHNRILGPHWLTVRASGAGDGAIGARVTVDAGGRTTRQILLAGGSYLAGPPRELYFGLADATRADVTVQWADGSITRREGVGADTILDVARP